MTKRFPILLLCLLLLATCAQADTQENPFLGSFTLETVYISPLSATTMDAHAEEMDGTTIELGENTFSMRGTNLMEVFTLENVIFEIEVFDEAEQAALFDTLLLDDEALKRPYDMRCVMTDADGNNLGMTFYTEGDDLWMFSMAGTTEEGQDVVMSAYKMIRE